MRNTISKWVAAFAVLTASAAPAMACGYNPCGLGYGYGYAATYEQLPDPTPVTRQYYYANQGPTFSGPGNFAPVPTYQETAIGWRGYPRYDGGPYASPIDHYSYTPAYRAPIVYSYQPRLAYPVRPSYRYGYGMRPRMHYGYSHRGYSHRGYAPRYANYQSRRYATPRVIYGSRHGYHGSYPQQRALRRAY